MIELKGPDATSKYLEELGKSENELHEAARASFLGQNFFHEETDTASMIELHEKFMQDKHGRSFGERFAMAISDDYLGRVRVVELSSTDHDAILPGGSYKSPYHDLRHRLIQNDVIQGELTAEEGGRTCFVKPPVLSAPTGVEARVVVTRVRPLICADTVNESGTPLNFEIVKLSVFAMMKLQLAGLYTRYKVTPGEPWSEEMMQHVEDLLRASDKSSMHRVIHKIRTGYYLESHKR